MVSRIVATATAGLAILTLATPIPQTAIAANIQNTNDTGIMAASSRYSIEDLKGVSAFYIDHSDGGTIQHPVEGFDYRKAGPYLFPWDPQNNIHIGLRLPQQSQGWTLRTSNYAETNGEVRVEKTIVAPDGTTIINYVFKFGLPASFDTKQLDSIIPTVNDEPLSGWDSGKTEYDLRSDLPEDGVLRLSGEPAGWKRNVYETKLPDGRGMVSVDWTSPNNLTSKTYWFYGVKLGDPGLGDLAALKATAGNKTVNGFDYRKTDYTVARKADVQLSRIPAGWTAETKASDYRTEITLKAKANGYKRTFAFSTPVKSRSVSVESGDQWTLSQDAKDPFVWRLRDTPTGDNTIPAVTLATMPDTLTVTTTLDDGKDTIVKDTIGRLKDPVGRATGYTDPLTGERVDTTTWRYTGSNVTMDVNQGTKTLVEARTATINGMDYPLAKNKQGVWMATVTTTGGLPGNTVDVTVHNNKDLKKVTLTRTSHTDSNAVYSSDDGKTLLTVNHKDWQAPASGLENVKAILPDGSQVPGFDPVKGGDFPVPTGTAGVRLTGIPSGWTAVPLTDGRIGHTLTDPDRTFSITYTFTPSETPGPSYSKEDLKTVVAKADGKTIQGFDPVNGGTFQVPYGTKKVTLENIPQGWTGTPLGDGLGYTMTSGDGKLTVTYEFQEAAKEPSLQDLKNVVAKADGKTVQGFDPVNGGTFAVPAGTRTVTLENIPDDWIDTPLEDGLGFTLASRDGKLTVEYRFTPEQEPEPEPSYSAQDLKQVVAKADGKTIQGFDPVNGGEFTVPNGTKKVTLENLPDKWTASPSADGLSFTVVSPDGKISVSYRFTPEQTPEPSYSAQDLKQVVAKADGKTIQGFDPVNGGMFTVPAGTKKVTLGNVPDGWNAVPSQDNLTFTVTSPDGKVTVEYRFQEAMPSWSVDDLKQVTALADGQPIQGFDPAGGEFTVPAGTKTVTLKDVPQGWTSERLTDGLGFTVSSPDGSVTVTYRFTPATPAHSLDELKAVTVLADGRHVQGFDPTRDGTWTVPEDTEQVTLTGLPDGWTAARLDTGLGFTVSSEDGLSVVWRFQPKAHEYTADDLKGVTAWADGKQIQGFDPVKGGTFEVPAGTGKITLKDIPDGWTSMPTSDGLGRRLTSPDGKVGVSYRFREKTEPETKPTLNDLKNVTVANASVPGFDPVNGGSWTLPNGVKPELSGVPAGWKATTVEDGHGWKVTVSNGSLKAVYRFANEYGPADLTGVGLHADGKPVQGFDPTTATQSTTVGMTATLTLHNLPDGWTMDGLTLTSPDGKYAIEYQVVRQWMRTDLKDMTVSVNGRPIKNFNPLKDGPWTIPTQGDPTAADLPDGLTATWTADDRGGSLKVTTGDGTVVAEYRFDRQTDADDGLGDVTILVNGKPVDMKPGATIRVGKDAAIRFDNLPDGWTAASQRDGDVETWTLTGPDGRSVVYRFEHAAADSGDGSDDSAEENNPAGMLADTGVRAGGLALLAGLFAGGLAMLGWRRRRA